MTERGQASVALVAILSAVLVGGLILGGVARGLGARADAQRAADVAALAAAKTMLETYPLLYMPGTATGHVELAAYLARGRAVAASVARRNGARSVVVSFPGAGGGLAPTRIRIRIADRIEVGGRSVAAGAVAEAELVLGVVGGGAGMATGGGYSGPLAQRQGVPMRPDTALGFDRLAAAARRDGVTLLVVSGYRSDAEQARLFAAHPDPKWVARPGTSLHRLGTELDLGPASAYGWLARNAPRLGWVLRYSWEPWHWGWKANAGTASVGQLAGKYDADRHTTLPGFVPSRYAPMIARAAQRWNVSGTLLAAQINQESGFNPFARSSAGAQGIAQFMPGTASAYGLRNPYDPAAAIDAQAHLMRDLLRRFGAVPLALAAYNAGPGAVARCGCIPPYPETQAYVAAILGLMRGAGDVAGGGLDALDVRLVR